MFSAQASYETQLAEYKSSYSHEADIERAYKIYVDSTSEEKEKYFKQLCDAIISYSYLHLKDCAKYVEEKILPQFCDWDESWGLSRIHKYGTHSLKILALQKQLSPDAFQRRAAIISKNEKILQELYSQVLYKEEFDDVFKDSPLSLKAIIQNSLDKMYRDNTLFINEIALKRLMVYQDELAEKLPLIVLKCPALIIKIDELHNHHINDNLRNALAESMLSYCKTDNTNSKYRMIFLDRLFERNKNKYGVLRKELFQTYFNQAQKVEEKMDIVFHLLSSKKEGDTPFAIQLLASLLKVTQGAQVEKIIADNHATIKMKEIIERLFRYATADLQTQMEVMHVPLESIYHQYDVNDLLVSSSDVDFNKEIYPLFYRSFSLANYICETVFHTASVPTEFVENEMKEEKRSQEANIHYAIVMESLKKPQGISIEQIDAAVLWWGDLLRISTGNRNAYIHDAVNYQNELAEARLHLRPDLEKGIQRFEQILKTKLLLAVGARSLNLKIHYDLDQVIENAMIEAKTNYFAGYPHKAKMEINGNTALKKESIRVSLYDSPMKDLPIDKMVKYNELRRPISPLLLSVNDEKKVADVKMLLREDAIPPKTSRCTIS